jgi:hypothetical protein
MAYRIDQQMVLASSGQALSQTARKDGAPGWAAKIQGLKLLDSRLWFTGLKPGASTVRFARTCFSLKHESPAQGRAFFLCISSLAIYGEIVGETGAGFFFLECAG